VKFADRGGFWNIAFMGGLIAVMYHMLDGSETVTMWGGWVAGGAIVADFLLGFASEEER
jgi:lipid-A-disaccharide synthase-like uncharacterized protein